MNNMGEDIMKIKIINIILFILGIALIVTGVMINTSSELKEDSTSNLELQLQESLQVIFYSSDQMKIMTNEENFSQTSFTVKNILNRAVKYRVKLTSDRKDIYDAVKINLLKNGDKMIDNQKISDVITDDGVVYETVISSDAIEKYQISIATIDSDIQVPETMDFQVIIELMSFSSSSDSDGIAPTIRLNGDVAMSLFQNEPFEDPGVAAIIDNVDNIISSDEIQITYYYTGEGENNEKETVDAIDSSKLGTYYIYYQVSDTSGNFATAIRLVYIKEKTSSTIEEPDTPATETPALPSATSTPLPPTDSSQNIQEQVNNVGNNLRETLTNYLKELYDSTTIYDQNWKNENQSGVISISLEELQNKFSFDFSMFHTEEIQCDNKGTYGTIHFYSDGRKEYKINLQCLYYFNNNYYDIK